MKIKVFNPANPSEMVFSHEEMSADIIPSVMKKARLAQKKWEKIPSIERGKIVSKFLDVLEARAEEIAISITKEMGKTINESRGEVAKGLGEGRMMVARSNIPIGEVLPAGRPGFTTYTTRRPRGVIAGICPWNFPFSTPIRKSIPALVYGNAIVLKASSFAPSAIMIMADAAKDILPDDLFKFVLGKGGMGSAMSSSKDIDGLSFTGSVAVGKLVAQASAQNLVEVSLELGGKNPVILNDASDLDVALSQIYTAAMAISGQRCTAISRVIVHKDLAEATVAGLSARAEATIVGDGMNPDTKMGPLMNQNQMDNVSGFVARAVEQGASISAGGIAVDSDTKGFFYRPTILSNVASNMEVAKEEVFGPVLSVITYETVEQALAISNDVAYGLTSCLFSENSAVIEQFINETESGMIHVNVGSFPDDHMPFVGLKNSSLGVGGSNGASTMYFYTSEHAVYIKGKA